MKLFVISTPSQAFFLSKTANLVNGESLLLITENKEGTAVKILSYLDKISWRKIMIWDTIGTSKRINYYKIGLFYFKLKWVNANYPGISEVLIGSYDNKFHLGVLGFFEPNIKIWLLYDGLQMVSVAQKRFKSIENSLDPMPWIFTFFSLKKPEIVSLTYTSPFILEIPKNDRLWKINVDGLNHPQLVHNIVYFIGQPLVDMGIVDLNYFIKKLTEIVNRFKEFDVKYIPHPKESTGILNKVSEVMEISQFDKVLEEVYLTKSEFAGVVVSFYSSVLINLSFFNSPVLLCAVNINMDRIRNERKRMDIGNIYSYFRSVHPRSITIID